MPAEDEDLPGTLQRSPKHAQDIYRETLSSAHESYGDDEERAHRAAFASVKHSYRKVGDHWEAKDKKGPSDPQAAKSGREALEDPSPTAGGKEVGVTKKELYAQARELGGVDVLAGAGADCALRAASWPESRPGQFAASGTRAESAPLAAKGSQREASGELTG